MRWEEFPHQRRCVEECSLEVPNGNTADIAADGGCRSRSGGGHLYFAHPAGEVRARADLQTQNTITLALYYSFF
jgi:hypothetical protein